MTFQESIESRRFTASAVLFEPTKRGGSAGTGYAKSVRLTPYDRRGDYGEAQEFNFDHPEFRGMVEAATSCTHGMMFSEEKITGENLADFSRTVLSSPYCEDPMEKIKQAMKMIESRKEF